MLTRVKKQSIYETAQFIFTTNQHFGHLKSEKHLLINLNICTVNAYLLMHALKAGLLLLVHALEPG